MAAPFVDGPSSALAREPLTARAAHVTVSVRFRSKLSFFIGFILFCFVVFVWFLRVTNCAMLLVSSSNWLFILFLLWLCLLFAVSSPAEEGALRLAGAVVRIRFRQVGLAVSI